MKRYIVEVDTDDEMLVFVRKLQAAGTLVSISTRAKVGRSEIPSIGGTGPLKKISFAPAKRVPVVDHLHTPEGKARALAARNEFIDAKKKQIVDTLTTLVLENHPAAFQASHAAKLLNATKIRTFQGNKWDEKNIMPYLEPILTTLFGSEGQATDTHPA